jgi:hypothetical protein
MKIRLPRFYYVLRCKLRRFIARNWTGCEYCNEEALVKLLGGDADSLGNQFNTLLDSVPINGSKRNIACYFYPMRGCIEVTEVDKDMKMPPLQSIFVSNCPECGRVLHKIRFKKKEKTDD